MNLATSYLDGSDLYESEEEEIRNLRSFRDGQVLLDNCNRFAYFLFLKYFLSQEQQN